MTAERLAAIRAEATDAGEQLNSNLRACYGTRAARQIIPELTDEVERLQAELAACQARLAEADQLLADPACAYDDACHWCRMELDMRRVPPPHTGHHKDCPWWAYQQRRPAPVPEPATNWLPDFHEFDEVIVTGRIISERNHRVAALRGVIGTLDREEGRLKIWPENQNDPQLPAGGTDGKLWFSPESLEAIALWESS